MSEMKSPTQKNWGRDNVLPDQGYRTLMKTVIDESVAIVEW
jgi:hypothetical protein